MKNGHLPRTSISMLNAYSKLAAEREAQGVPALPLTAEQTKDLTQLLENPPTDGRQFLLHLLIDRIPPGVDEAAYVKATWLSAVAQGNTISPLVTPLEATRLLGTMVGGYNVAALIELLKNSDEQLADCAAQGLSRTLLVYDAFNEVMDLAASNRFAKQVVDSWAEAEWFKSRTELAESITVTVFKVDGETNTDDLSPATHATTRPDIPLHALAMLETSVPNGLKTIAKLKENGHPVAYVGDVVGTGSSRKSAINSVLWHTGNDIPHVPNKRGGGVIIGGKIAPIFFNTAEDSGALPIECDVSQLNTGDVITIRPHAGTIERDGSVISHFDLKPSTISDEVRAGGTNPSDDRQGPHRQSSQPIGTLSIRSLHSSQCSSGQRQGIHTGPKDGGQSLRTPRRKAGNELRAAHGHGWLSRHHRSDDP
jgi:aconitate hydratase 2/2-methylisocitrate dehydratase